MFSHWKSSRTMTFHRLSFRRLHAVEWLCVACSWAHWTFADQLAVDRRLQSSRNGAANVSQADSCISTNNLSLSSWCCTCMNHTSMGITLEHYESVCWTLKVSFFLLISVHWVDFTFFCFALIHNFMFKSDSATEVKLCVKLNKLY